MKIGPDKFRNLNGFTFSCNVCRLIISKDFKAININQENELRLGSVRVSVSRHHSEDRYLFHRKQMLLVNFRPVIYFIGSNDLYNLENLLVNFQSSFELNTWNIGALTNF